MRTISLFICLICIFQTTNTFAKTTGSNKIVNTPTAEKQANKVIWDEWYTLTLQGTIPAAAYNERLEKDSQGRLIYKNKTSKLEENYTNEESLTAIAESMTSLKPVLFNFHRTYRSSELTIDGTLQPDGSLVVKVLKDGQESPAIRKRLTPNALLSSFFPVLLGNAAEKLKVNQTSGFQSILEDNEELGFTPQSGTLYLKPDDDFSKKTQTKKFQINHLNQTSIWYVEVSGLPVRIEFPSKNALIQKTTREKALNFLHTQTPE